MDDNDIIGSAANKTGDCLGPVELSALLAGKATPAAHSHLEACPYCQTELAMLREFEDGQPSPDEVAAVKRVERGLRSAPAWKPAPAKDPGWFHRFWSSPARGLAFAGLAAMLVMTVWINQRPTPDPGGVPGADTVRSGQVDLISPLGDISQAPVDLRWRAVPGASRYQVHLTEVDGTLLWDGASAAEQVSLPVAVQALMTDRKTLYWVVSAFDSTGTRVGSSSRQMFRVVAEAK